MVTPKKGSGIERKPRAKATTPEARENQLISLAHDVAEKQMLEGTASAMVITHYLKLGTEKTKLENRQMEQRIVLDEARVDALESGKNVAELYEQAIKAMRRYQGQDDTDEDV